jgi:hypothetical protein
VNTPTIPTISLFGALRALDQSGSKIGFLAMAVPQGVELVDAIRNGDSDKAGTALAKGAPFLLAAICAGASPDRLSGGLRSSADAQRWLRRGVFGLSGLFLLAQGVNEEAKAWIELGRAAADAKNTESKSHLDKAWDRYADSAYTMGSRVIDTLALSSATFGVLARVVAASAPARLGAGGILAEAARAGARAQILAAALGVQPTPLTLTCPMGKAPADLVTGSSEYSEPKSRNPRLRWRAAPRPRPR